MSLDIKSLPKSLQNFIGKYPKVWEAYIALGEASGKAGPLSEKYIQLLRMVITGVKRQETSFKTHVRLALRSGAQPDEIQHAVILLLTAEGMGTTIRVMNWAVNVIGDETAKKHS